MQGNELAEKLGVSEGAISNWLQGANGPKGENLRKLAEILDVEISWLTGDDIPNAPKMPTDQIGHNPNPEAVRLALRVLKDQVNAVSKQIEYCEQLCGALTDSAIERVVDAEEASVLRDTLSKCETPGRAAPKHK